MKKLIIGTLALIWILVSVFGLIMAMACESALMMIIVVAPVAVYLALPSKWQFLDRMEE